MNKSKINYVNSRNSKKAHVHFIVDKSVKDEFKSNCVRLGHNMGLMVEILMEHFNANQVKSKNYGKKNRL